MESFQEHIKHRLNFVKKGTNERPFVCSLAFGEMLTVVRIDYACGQRYPLRIRTRSIDNDAQALLFSLGGDDDRRHTNDHEKKSATGNTDDDKKLSF